MRRSDPIFATSLDVPTPTLTVSPVSEWIATLIRRAISSGGPNSASEPATSRKASSIDTCSRRDVNRRRIVMTRRLSAWYFTPSTGTKTPCGHSRPAVRSGIAERTPKTRAS